MKSIITKLMAAEKWGHHHTVLVFCALFLFGFMAFWQLLMPQMDTHAASLDCSTATNINTSENECNALMDFFVSTNGDGWTDSTNWGIDTDICTRYGIQCFPNEIRLVIENNNLLGTLPNSIGNLVNMGLLDVNNNYLDGEIPVSLWTIAKLHGVQFRNNNFSGYLSHDFSLASGLNIIDVAQNNNIIVDLDTLNEIDADTLGALNIGGTIIGDFNNIGRFTGLEYLEIRGGNQTIDNIWSRLPNLHSLTQLSLKELGLGGNLPDIWDNFPNLQYLGLQFNRFIGPLPPSLASLTNLTSIEISYNNFDGPIPTYLSTLPINQGQNNYTDISANCFDTNIEDEGFIAFLDGNFPGRTSQYNCRANIQATSSVGTGLVPGTCTTYRLSYNNLGPQVANNLKIGQTFDPQIIVGSSNPAYTTGTVGAEYGTLNDPCYYNAAVNATGPYYAALDNIMQLTYGASLRQLVTNGLDFTGAQGTTEFAYAMDNACPFLFGTENKQLCFLMFGLDMTDVDPSCGFGGDPGYIWNLGNLPNAGSGGIDVDICLPIDATGSVSFTSLITTLSTNENGNGNGQTFNFTITGSGNNQGQGTGNNQGGNGGGNTPPSGGNGGGGGSTMITTDQEAGICEVRDCSDSYYDGVCGVCDQQHNSAGTSGAFLIDDPLAFMQEVGNVMGVMACTVSQELVEAYVFSFDIGITSVGNICEADMYGPLIRKHLAKFLSMFAIRILGMHPDTTRVCAFTDMANESFEMQGFARIACQLGIMGLQQNGDPDTVFNPNQVVNRAMFGTALSRLIYGPIHNTETGIWYEAHLQALHDNGIMNDISNPFMDEVRGYVMLMMKRAYSILQQ